MRLLLLKRNRFSTKQTRKNKPIQGTKLARMICLLTEDFYRHPVTQNTDTKYNLTEVKLNLKQSV